MKAFFPFQVNGIRGLSVLGELTYYDIIWGVPFDTVHGAFLGVTKYSSSFTPFIQDVCNVL